MRLVDDDRVVGREQPVALRLGEQDAVGHQLDERVGLRVVGEADLVADGRPRAPCPVPARCASRRRARRSAAAACGRSARARRGLPRCRSSAAASSCPSRFRRRRSRPGGRGSSARCRRRAARPAAPADRRSAGRRAARALPPLDRALATAAAIRSHSAAAARPWRARSMRRASGIASAAIPAASCARRRDAGEDEAMRAVTEETALRESRRRRTRPGSGADSTPRRSPRVMIAATARRTAACAALPGHDSQRRTR